MAKRMRTKLREIKEQLMATRHDWGPGVFGPLAYSPLFSRSECCR